MPESAPSAAPPSSPSDGKPDLTGVHVKEISHVVGGVQKENGWVGYFDFLESVNNVVEKASWGMTGIGAGVGIGVSAGLLPAALFPPAIIPLAAAWAVTGLGGVASSKMNHGMSATIYDDLGVPDKADRAREKGPQGLFRVDRMGEPQERDKNSKETKSKFKPKP